MSTLQADASKAATHRMYDVSPLGMVAYRHIIRVLVDVTHDHVRDVCNGERGRGVEGRETWTGEISEHCCRLQACQGVLWVPLVCFWSAWRNDSDDLKGYAMVAHMEGRK